MDIFKNIMLLIVSPRVGWEDINAGGIATSRIMRVAFFPLLALLAISAFMPMLHDHTLTLSKSLMTAIIQFSSFFFQLLYRVLSFGRLLSRTG